MIVMIVRYIDTDYHDSIDYRDMFRATIMIVNFYYHPALFKEESFVDFALISCCIIACCLAFVCKPGEVDFLLLQKSNEVAAAPYSPTLTVRCYEFMNAIAT